MINPMDDPARLEALNNSGLLDKDMVGRLNHLTYSAVAITGADASQINMLESVTQYTIAQHPEPRRNPIPVRVSACYRVILTAAPMIIPDATNDPEVCDLPWAQDFRAYLGVPVFYDGEAVGSVCVLGVEPREWRQHDLLALESLATLVCLSAELDDSSSDGRPSVS